MSAKRPTPARVIRRAVENAVPEGECLVSRYSTASHGYAQVGWREDGKSHMRLVHRLAWEHANGPIPDGMTVDHLCHNRRCLRIDHLRLLTNLDNARRNRPGRDFPVGLFCHRGHPEEARIAIRRHRRSRVVTGWTCGECQRTPKSEATA